MSVNPSRRTVIASGYWNELASAMKANENPDREAFRNAMLPVWDEFNAAVGEAGKLWIDRVMTAAK